MTKVAVIGSGFSGLSAACFLAKEGCHVTVFEKNGSPGGRARKFEVDGYVFDMGPSWYWMPDVFEKFFKAFGKELSDYYTLKRLDPSYRVYFAENDWLDLPANLDELKSLFESIEPGSAKQLQKFLAESAYKYEVGINDLVYKPGLSLTELLDMRLAKGLLRMHVLQSISTYVRKHFKNEKLIQLLEFPVLFLGAKPSKTPALYSLMNYADMTLGTWYPEGGMHKIVEAMVSVAESLGVKFQYNHTVEAIEVKDNKASALKIKGQSFVFDYIIAGADYHHVEQQLLPKSHRKYSPEYWDKRVMAPGSLIFYLGINTELKNLLHHNLFFDKDFTKHAQEIYDEPQWPSDPLFYVCCTSKSDNTAAPAGHENVFILIPTAPGLQDEEATREKYYKMVMERLEKLTGQEIRSKVVYKRAFAHNDFIGDYNS
ncbi:MAG TPA: phytoene desaturase family protein, partial [Cyclobacteriaceae bacterium]|nr:phytoene desaturase family protein [Cyclobacteriaceae bacterium]